MKKCPRCHKDIPNDVDKCPYCGYKLGYGEENKKNGGNFQPPPPKRSLLRRIIYYSLIAGLFFGPRFYNAANNDGSAATAVHEVSQFGEDQIPIALYSSVADYLIDYPDSEIVTKIAAFENDFYNVTSTLGSSPFETTYQYIITNTGDVYINGKYRFEIRGEDIQVAANFNTYNNQHTVNVNFTRFAIEDFSKLSLAVADYSEFYEITDYLGNFAAPLNQEAQVEFDEILSASEADEFIGHYGRGVTLHNNGSTLKVYYGSDTLTSQDDALRYFQNLEFDSILKEGLVETL